MTVPQLKERVAASFSRSAAIYDEHAEEQRVAALALAEYAAENVGRLVQGPVLEIGCGTGLLSVELAGLLPGRDLEFSDISPAMVEQCREKMAAASIVDSRIAYSVLDGELLVREEYYALICASFSVHWFGDLAAGLQRMVRALKPGGRLLCAYPGAGSYREWHQQCARLGVACSANPLPDRESVKRSFPHEMVNLQQWQQELVLRFTSARAFLHHLKQTGASTPTRREAVPLGPAQLRTLLREWDWQAPNGVEITCDIHFFAVERIG